MLLEKIHSPEDFEKLQGEWNRLLDTSASDCLFLSWEWLMTWWKHFSGKRKLSILTLRDADELVAIAPLASTPPRLGVSPFRCLEFLGTGSVGSDYLDFLLKRGREPEAVRVLVEYFTRVRSTLLLDHLHRGACSAAAVAEKLREEGWGLYEAKSNVSPFVALRGHTWESYLATLSAEHRYNFKRRLKNLGKQFNVRFCAATTEHDRRQALSLLVSLHQRRWRQNGGAGVFRTPGLLPFHEEMSRLALARGWLRLFVLWLNDTPVASLYGFRYRNVFYFYQSGFDPDYRKFSVGLVTMGLAIKSALEEGVEEYDLLYGDEPYKFLWVRQTRELGRLELYPPSVLGRLHQQVLELNRVMRRTARRLLTQPTGSPV